MLGHVLQERDDVECISFNDCQAFIIDASQGLYKCTITFYDNQAGVWREMREQLSGHDAGSRSVFHDKTAVLEIDGLDDVSHRRPQCRKKRSDTGVTYAFPEKKNMFGQWLRHRGEYGILPFCCQIAG